MLLTWEREQTANTNITRRNRVTNWDMLRKLAYSEKSAVTKAVTHRQKIRDLLRQRQSQQ